LYQVNADILKSAKFSIGTDANKKFITNGVYSLSPSARPDLPNKNQTYVLWKDTDTEDVSVMTISFTIDFAIDSGSATFDSIKHFDFSKVCISNCFIFGSSFFEDSTNFGAAGGYLAFYGAGT
jgi:hypothetical protein